ncbi:TlpA disulfide reductase family protein [Sphingobacterium allocomposti]|nr:TlpA disulfide reductase family protein [Sphingobacterium composti Yoo et al. 2007 non Ten et al. 2007]
MIHKGRRGMVDVDKKKIRRIIKNLAVAALILVLVLPAGRIWVQRGLMKIGLFRPDLEQPKEGSQTPSAVGHTAPEVTFLNNEGNTVRVSDLKGKVVFLNFWATWCPPCKAEMPSIQILKDKFKGNGNVVFLLVEIEGERQKAQMFMEQGNMDLPVVYPQSDIPPEWLGQSIPTTVILNKEGRVAARHEGMADYSRTEVSNFITELLNK